jgi:hypothetical protein
VPTKSTTLFFLVVLFLCSWHLDHGTNDNSMARAASVASLVDRGTLEITPIHEVTGDKALVDGRYYSDKAPLPTFAVLPFHAMAVWSGLIKAGEHGTIGPALLRLGGFLCGSIPLALIITLIWLDLRKRSEALPLNASLLATLPFFGSFLFVYSGSFYNHLPSALFALLGARSVLHDKPLLVGLWGGCAFLCESVLLVLPALWCVQWLLHKRWQTMLPLAMGILPGLLGTMAHNMAVTGHPLVMPNAFAANYEAMHTSYGFGTWQPDAFLGMLVTDYRGLLFYMPILVLGLWILPRNMRSTELLRDPFVLPALLLVAAFLTHATWWGGWTYGPRYIMAPTLLLTVATLYRVKNGALERWSVLALSGFGMLCAFAAKNTIWYSFPTGVQHPLLAEVWPRIAKGEWTSMQWPVLLGLSPGLATALFVAIFVAGLFALVRIDRSTTTA